MRGIESSASAEGTVSREKRDRDLESAPTLSDRQISIITRNGKLNLPFEEKMQLRKDSLKLKPKPIWRSEVGHRNVQKWPGMTLIENSTLKDWNYINRINEQIKLKEKRLFHVENWKRGIDSSKEVTPEIAKKLRNYEESIAKKHIESDN